MSVRVTLSGTTRKEHKERVAGFAKRAFSLNDDEAERLAAGLMGAADGCRLKGRRARALVAAGLPLELVLVAPDEKIQRTFAPMGIEAQFSPMQVAYAACVIHPKLASSELCPRCKSERACRACVSLSAHGACPTCVRKINFRTRFRRIRIGVLLAIFGAVALTAWLEKRRITSWKRPLVVRIHAIAGEDHKNVTDYVPTVNDASFDDIAPFFEREAARYGISTKSPVEIYAGTSLSELPPPPPDPEDRTMIAIALWSLHLRWWTFRAVQKYDLEPADVRMFAIYHRAAPGVLEHSTGLERVRVGIAHLYAGAPDEAANDVVIAHELLHIVGAADQYDESGQPIFPDGYAEPDRSPLHPQVKAEIMAGRIPSSQSESRVADHLEACVIGKKTAAQIGWAR